MAPLTGNLKVGASVFTQPHGSCLISPWFSLLCSSTSLHWLHLQAGRRVAAADVVGISMYDHLHWNARDYLPPGKKKTISSCWKETFMSHQRILCPFPILKPIFVGWDYPKAQDGRGPSTWGLLHMWFRPGVGESQPRGQTQPTT